MDALLECTRLRFVLGESLVSEQFGQPIRLHAPDDSGEFPLPESGGRAVTLTEYDALADLFLAGSSSMAPPSERPRPAAAAASPSAPRTSHASHQSHASNASAAMTTAAPAPAANSLASSTRRVEAIIVGHLPVLAAVWVGQYARRLAETLGQPVALVRLHAGQCSLEITGDLSARAQAELVTHAASNPPIDRAIELASKHAAAWLIRTDEPDELALAEHAGVTDITLLTGADDMALVATYRTLKALATGASGFHESNASESASNLRIAILGSTPEKATAAETKLSRAASTFLGRPVTILNAGQRIGAAPTVTLHRANAAVPASHIFEVLARVAPAAPTPVQTPASDSIPSFLAPAMPTESSSRIGPSRFDTHLNTIEPKAAPSRVTSTPKDLPTLFDGMRSLPTRCPYAPSVQFGLDPKGRLHLFAMPEAEATIRELKPEAPTADATHTSMCDGLAGLAPAQTLAQLVAASGWAFDHMDLLRLAAPAFTISSDASDTTLHLLTSEPKSVRRLLDSGVLVHAVLPATVGGTTTWVVRDLN